MICCLSGFSSIVYSLDKSQPSTPESKIINGLNPTHLKELLDNLEKFPIAGYVTFFSNTQGEGGTKSKTTSIGYEIEGTTRKKNKFELQGDDLPELGGSDAMPSVMEELLSAVGVSVVGKISMKAALMQVELSKIEVSLESDINLRGTLQLDRKQDPGILDLRVVITIAGNADEKTLREIAKDGWEFSPVANTVSYGTTIVEPPKIDIAGKGFSLFFDIMKKSKALSGNQNRFNGLNIENLRELAILLKKDPKEALVTFFSKTNWEGGSKSSTTISGYQFGKTKKQRTFTLQGEAALGFWGSNRVPGAMELLMHTIGASIIASINENAALEAVKISKVQVSLEGDIDVHGAFELDPDIRPGLLDLRIAITIGGDTDADSLKRIALEGYELSPVADTIRNGTRITSSPKILIGK